MGTVIVPTDLQVLLRGGGCHAALHGSGSGVKVTADSGGRLSPLFAKFGQARWGCQGGHVNCACLVPGCIVRMTAGRSMPLCSCNIEILVGTSHVKMGSMPVPLEPSLCPRPIPCVFVVLLSSLLS